MNTQELKVFGLAAVATAINEMGLQFGFQLCAFPVAVAIFCYGILKIFPKEVQPEQ